MKQKFLFFFLLFYVWQGCQNNNKTQDNESVKEDYYQFQCIDLQKFDIDAELMVPDATAGIGASFKPEIVHSPGDFKWIVKIGRNFELNIEDYGDNSFRFLEMRKKLLKNKIFKIEILKEQNNQILFIRNMDKTYHVYAVKKLGDIHYEFTCRESGYTKKVAEFIFKSIQSFKKIKNEY
jgi:hypothetical protein